MTGIQFKLIRMANKISAKKICNQMGLKSKSPCLDAEKLSQIPRKFVMVLEKIIGLDLQDNETVERIVEESSQEFYRLDERCKLWDSKYAKLIEQGIVRNGGSLQYDSKGRFKF